MFKFFGTEPEEEGFRLRKTWFVGRGAEGEGFGGISIVAGGEAMRVGVEEKFEALLDKIGEEDLGGRTLKFSRVW